MEKSQRQFWRYTSIFLIFGGAPVFLSNIGVLNKVMHMFLCTTSAHHFQTCEVVHTREPKMGIEGFGSRLDFGQQGRVRPLRGEHQGYSRHRQTADQQPRLRVIFG